MSIKKKSTFPILSQETRESIANECKRAMDIFFKIRNETRHKEGNDFIRENGFIAGGFIRDLILGVEINDIDIYTKKEIPKHLFNKNKPNSCNIYDYMEDQFIYSIIHDHSGRTPQRTISTFDFTINQNYYDIKTGELHIGDERSILAKELIFVKKSDNPINALCRSQFRFNDFTIDPLELIKMGIMISTMDPILYKEDLEKHFVGSSGRARKLPLKTFLPSVKDKERLKQEAFDDTLLEILEQ